MLLYAEVICTEEVWNFKVFQQQSGFGAVFPGFYVGSPVELALFFRGLNLLLAESHASFMVVLGAIIAGEAIKNLYPQQVALVENKLNELKAYIGCSL